MVKFDLDYSRFKEIKEEFNEKFRKKFEQLERKKLKTLTDENRFEIYELLFNRIQALLKLSEFYFQKAKENPEGEDEIYTISQKFEGAALEGDWILRKIVGNEDKMETFRKRLLQKNEINKEFQLINKELLKEDSPKTPSKITIKFNAKSRSKNAKKALELLRDYPLEMIDEKFCKVEMDLSETILKELIKIVRKLKGTTILIENEEINWKKFLSIFFCPYKSTCDGICKHIEIKTYWKLPDGSNYDQHEWIKLDQMSGCISDNGRFGVLIKRYNYISQRIFFDFLQEIGWQEYLLDKEKIMKYIQENYFLEQKYCEKFSIKKIIQYIEELPSILKTSYKNEIEFDVIHYNFLLKIQQNLKYLTGIKFSLSAILYFAIENFLHETNLHQLAQYLAPNIPYKTSHFHKIQLYSNFKKSYPPKIWKRIVSKEETETWGVYNMENAVQEFIDNLTPKELEFLKNKLSIK
ncbi:MAG: hypothetical protein ACTSRP_22380 [Candidatus Helarchaeota archaeon]